MLLVRSWCLQQYDTHFVQVDPDLDYQAADPEHPPIKVFEELVVKNESQLLPRFIVFFKEPASPDSEAAPDAAVLQPLLPMFDSAPIEPLPAVVIAAQPPAPVLHSAVPSEPALPPEQDAVRFVILLLAIIIVQIDASPPESPSRWRLAASDTRLSIQTPLLPKTEKFPGLVDLACFCC